MKNVRVLLCALLVVVGLTLVVGCNKGPKRFPVSGTVISAGPSISGGTVEFRGDPNSDSFTSCSTMIASDGTFEIPSTTGLSAGEYTVVFTLPNENGIGAGRIIEAKQKATIKPERNVLTLEVPKID